MVDGASIGKVPNHSSAKPTNKLAQAEKSTLGSPKRVRWMVQGPTSWKRQQPLSLPSKLA